jgi:peptidoglycan/LPS O-acetylase OafA/YrhL
MLEVGFRRLFWIGAAGLLGLAALISIVALVRGDFTDTDWKILASLGIALGAGSACLAGLALVDRGELVWLGWAAVATGVGAFAVIMHQVWTESHSDERWTTALLLLGAVLLAATGRLLLPSGKLESLYNGHLILSAVATAGTIGVIWDEGETPDSWGKLLGAMWILAALAWFLVPVLGRSSTRVSERVVGHGPGRVEVELAEGETLVVRGR